MKMSNGPGMVQPGSSSPWVYSDLRQFDPVDVDDSALDFIAIYSRDYENYLDIRLDFLDLSQYLPNDIFLAIDCMPGGKDNYIAPDGTTITTAITWDLFLAFNSSGAVYEPEIINMPGRPQGINIMRNQMLDYVVVSFDLTELKSCQHDILIQAFTKDSSKKLVADSSEIVKLISPPPPPVQIVIGFWNTFLGYTPSQALRSWDGAHTGPFSERHGLKYLIAAAKTTKTPIALFDLNQPTTLSALDYMEVVPEITSLSMDNLLISPEALSFFDFADTESLPYFPPEWMLSTIADRVRNTSNGFDYPTGPTIYAPYPMVDRPVNIETYFVSSCVDCSDLVCGDFVGAVVLCVNDYAHYLNNTYISTNESIHNLIKSLSDSSQYLPRLPILIGGDFKQSSFGFPDHASRIFEYIKAHPWIQPLDTYGVQSLKAAHPYIIPSSPELFDYIPYSPDGIQIPSGLTASQIQSLVLDGLRTAPQNEIVELGWDTYSMLISPGNSELIELRANYLGQIGHLLVAAHWAENPDSYSSCQEDIDWDGQPECVFASQDFFATFELMGGYMAFAFHRSSRGVHQVIGPTYQFLVGMSDPTLWNPNLGIAGDPGQILGALIEDSPIWKMYDYQVSENELRLSLDEVAIRKVFRFIGEDQIHMDLSNPDNTSVLIPFALDPWTRFIPGWGNLYQSFQNPDGMIWGIDNQLSISIDSDQLYEFIQFNRSHTALFSPEDPNYDYSAGHFLPFPIALLRINDQQTVSLDLTFSSVIK